MSNYRIPCLIGQFIGRYGIIDQFYIYDEKYTRNILWFTCKCICGNIKNVRSSSLLHGKILSCGCLTKIRMKLNNPAICLSYGESSFNTLYKWYKDNASKRNLEFSLTKEQFKVLTKGQCVECGIFPLQICHPRQKDKYYSNGEYIYNGIDRRDNNLGYELENCVTCCGRCNQSKLNMSIEEWNQWKIMFVNHNKDLLQ